MKISCLPVTFFGPILRDKTMTRKDWFGVAAEVGLHGTEIYETWVDGMDDAGIRALGEAVQASGIEVSMFSCENNFSGGKASEIAPEQVHKAVDAASILNCDVVRVTAVSPFGTTGMAWREAEKYDRAELVRNAAAGLKGCLDYAEEHGVHLALENHPIIGSFVEEYMQILELVDDDRLKVNLDTSNFALDTMVDFARQVADRVVHTHVKDRLENDSAVLMGKGGVDFEGIFKHLKKAGYDRWLSLEAMGGGREKLEADYAFITGVWEKA